ncbi:MULTISPECIES: hypothetical protein [unclassified Variovorax]|uniref:hypothetical protein n=1 Tax=unclassified Variovorax TaxID=663243 RepID=UPI00076BD1F4|nr:MULTISPECIES: hypothetical protein [unclassified Variovorax]KWT65071.1 phage-related hypothetical protein [Variovorax sp. WDL1]PNG49057.1 hypothetical protein CHC06_06294 [Variovorax sp. B2]PNG49442.1 hypothetical protein CHC07_06351 [Variovorax sp. B4]VTV18938.1 hypothetical protein WDL1P2_00546 [Variovorax sp. WDL1]
MSKDLNAWLKAGRHLPTEMRDFHDQKSLFAAMHALQDDGATRPKSAVDQLYEVSPVVGHVYVVDRFLWFMARRGWTLQRSRADMPFSDLSTDVQTVAAERRAQFGELIAPGGSRGA